MKASSKDAPRCVSSSKDSLKRYLQQRHTWGTATRYCRDIESYLQSLGEGNAKTATYADVVEYVGKLRERYNNPATIRVAVYAIKKYYSWLNHTGQRQSHPCKELKLKDRQNRDVQLQDLFKPEELELLMERKERYKDLKTRNQVIISLLIYQALTRDEITNLETTDINIEEGSINIKPGTNTNSRTLKLKPQQIMLFYKYIHETRPKLASTALSHRLPSQRLILTKLGTPETGEGISYLLETAKHQFPGRKLNPTTVRESVIANLLKTGHDLRLVQTFAGHKYPSTTERYRQTGLEELKAGIQKYHPLK